jgi:hypothetical protein
MEEIIGGTRSDEESSSNNTEFKLLELNRTRIGRFTRTEKN